MKAQLPSHADVVAVVSVLMRQMAEVRTALKQKGLLEERTDTGLIKV